MNPNPAKILHKIADYHELIHDGCFQHELSQICRHTKDRGLIAAASQAAELLGLDIDTQFRSISMSQHRDSMRTIARHMGRINEVFQDIARSVKHYDSHWVQPLFDRIEFQFVRLSQLVALLDRKPNNFEVNPGDLVVFPCKDESDRDYEHYGVVIAAATGFEVVHFFSGPTVQPNNRIAEIGVGYVHHMPYDRRWLLKEKLDAAIPYHQIQARIEASKAAILNAHGRVWNKMTYNCEHWAREMVYGVASCSQLEKLKQEASNRRKS